MTTEPPEVKSLLDHPGWRDGRRTMKMPHGYRSLDVANCSQLAEGSLSHVAARNQTAVRWATADLWEAIVAAIVRQLIRAPQARLLYGHLCGLRSNDEYCGVLPPTPTDILETSAEQFYARGLKFQYPKLLAAARRWPHLESLGLSDTEYLEHELERVPGLGPWSIQIIISDVTNDFSHYPHDDAAIRSAANACWPTEDLPSSPNEFRDAWRCFCGPNLSAMTIHALAFGRKT